MGGWATWANLLTTLRVAALPPSIYAILNQIWWLAAVLFTVAVVSDFYDGKIARRLHQTSPFGGLFDHATDAAYVTSCTWALAQLALINPWLAWLIAIAFTQYMLDSKALAGVALRMSAIGRSNGVAYYVLVGVVIGAELLGWQWLTNVAYWAAWALVASTVLSIADRAVTLLQHNNNST